MGTLCLLPTVGHGSRGLLGRRLGVGVVPHDDARSRAYRWGEDGLFGWCDKDQILCLSIAVWNGKDGILKERLFGLTNTEGNHGEDAKELWWHVDALPSHSWNRMMYAYPQRAYPYADLVRTNSLRTKLDPEYELLDTGILDDDRFLRSGSPTPSASTMRRPCASRW